MDAAPAHFPPSTPDPKAGSAFCVVRRSGWCAGSVSGRAYGESRRRLANLSRRDPRAARHGHRLQPARALVPGTRWHPFRACPPARVRRPARAFAGRVACDPPATDQRSLPRARACRRILPGARRAPLRLRAAEHPRLPAHGGLPVRMGVHARPQDTAVLATPAPASPIPHPSKRSAAIPVRVTELAGRRPRR